MTGLPFEILRIVFEDLSRPELLECQRTSKLWHAASSKQLYYDVQLYRGNSALFTRTLDSTPALGQNLKIINCHLSNNRKKKDDLLEHLFQYCPNLIAICSSLTDLAFWTRLNCAAKNGLLSRIQELPEPHEDSIETYVSTVLAFRNTLNCLTLCDQIVHSRVMEKIEFEAFETLAGQLHTFTALDYLKILRHSHQNLSFLEDIIQACPELMGLEVTFYPLPNSGHPIIPQLRSDNFVIVPRPDIILFRGSGERIMNSDQSLDYLIRKLPKLEELRIFHVGLYSDQHEHFDFYHSFDVSFGTLVRFFHYMYHIPYLKVECNFRIQVLLDAWVEFMTVSKMNDIQLRIVYDPDSFEFDPQGLPIVFSTGLKKVLTKMMVRSLYDVPPHTVLLQRVGRAVQTLSIENMWRIKELPDWSEVITTDGLQLHQDLQLCPNLKELKVIDSGGSFSTDKPLVNHDSLESLSFNYTSSKPDLATRGTLHFLLPKLKYLNLKVQNAHDMDPVYMPSTHLEVFKWEITSYQGLIDVNWKFYLKFTSEKGEHFIMGDTHKLYPCTRELYAEALVTEKLCLDITCLYIDKLEILLSKPHLHQSYTFPIEVL